MKIDEYKQKLISVVENMEQEHGCDIEAVKITARRTFPYGSKIFEVDIEM